MRQVLLAVLLAPVFALADEGMWLFDDFPAEAVKTQHGFFPTKEWLDRLRLGSLRLTGGCSASLVSAEGLVMTNHHCVRGCVEDLSAASRDLLASGFVARTREAEERCPKLEATQLQAITDVTSSVLAATAGAEGPRYQQTLKAELARLESECAKGDPTRRCDVVTLFHGAKFHLYQSRRFQDARLVFAPEFQMATFGGDPDNFNFPRFGFDAAFLRLYVDGKPLETPDALKWARHGAKEGELVFVSGHPGGTERSQTIAQLEFQRDVALPWSIASLAEQRGRLDEWMKADPKRQRVGKSRLRSIENSLKALRGRREALTTPGFLDGRRAEEAALRARAPDRARGAWDAVQAAMRAQRALWAEHRMKELGEAFQSELFQYARVLARYPVEVAKPNAERLREYTDAQLPALRQVLLGDAPISKELEKATFAWSLAKLRESLGADDPFVKSVLGLRTPDELAAELIDGTRLHDSGYRKSCFEGAGLGDGAAGPDALLAFARRIDPGARVIRKRHEDEVEAVVKKNAELLAEARRVVQGVAGYPDATFTLRLSYGQVKGYGAVKPMTTVGGLFSRATGKAPFGLSASWLSAREKLRPQTPYNLATTNDIIGGNSGSPLVNREGQVVGLVFDGNLQSLGGRYGYDGRENRTVAVHSELILTALEKVYGAPHLARELTAR